MNKHIRNQRITVAVVVVALVAMVVLITNVMMNVGYA